MALILGHWNDANLGCGEQHVFPTSFIKFLYEDADMTVPAVYLEVKSMTGCSQLGNKLKYMMGHT